MRSSIIFIGYISALAYCTPSQQALLGRDSKTAEIPDWHPPGPNDCECQFHGGLLRLRHTLHRLERYIDTGRQGPLLTMCARILLHAVRGPCPMMNTLANHGILPRDGRRITEEVVIKAMKQGLNFDAALAGIMFEQAVIANPEPNATAFTLYVLLQVVYCCRLVVMRALRDARC